ncbi:winged helix-turn-helix domain-containing protein [Micromonospora sp. U56]|nr:winged helix-turn-helix domain-containing protein [Micromonospora sp. U56]MBQ0896698.1 winged helix-turn-helix domain-containing protein [Micromonospora sp. U56]
MLDDGPVTQGWDDARWTLARVADVIERRFEVTYSLRGVSHLLHRMGYSLQVPTVGRSNAIRKRSPVGIAGGGRR